jgi:hypothetical protein
MPAMIDVETRGGNTAAVEQAARGSRQARGSTGTRNGCRRCAAS